MNGKKEICLPGVAVDLLWQLYLLSASLMLRLVYPTRRLVFPTRRLVFPILFLTSRFLLRLVLSTISHAVALKGGQPE